MVCISVDVVNIPNNLQFSGLPGYLYFENSDAVYRGTIVCRTDYSSN